MAACQPQSNQADILTGKTFSWFLSVLEVCALCVHMLCEYFYSIINKSVTSEIVSLPVLPVVTVAQCLDSSQQYSPNNSQSYKTVCLFFFLSKSIANTKKKV